MLITPKVVRMLNDTVLCKIAPSPIGGCGVFAIQDIKKGTRITDYHYSNLNMKKDFIVMKRKEFMLIKPAVRELILDRILFEKGQDVLIFLNPNHDAFLLTFINHSETPNIEPTEVENEYKTSRDIKAGEEILFSYRTSYTEFDDLTLEHMPFLK